MATTRLTPGHATLFLFGVFAASILLNIWLVRRELDRTRVVSVPDGDSIQLVDGRRVRLLGVDAPEKGRCMADEARSFLAGLVYGKRVKLTETVTDDFGRVLAYVWVGNTLVNHEVLGAGLARFTHTGKENYQLFKQTALLAQTARYGIWSDTCRATIPPTDCVIKGNLRAGVKTYFLPICPNYDQVIIDESFGDQWFCSEQEAAANGFAKATRCN